MRRRIRSTGRVSPEARKALDQLHRKEVNFDLAKRDELDEESGWNVDDYRRGLPPEPPGPPRRGGSWEIGRELMRDYAFADPAIVRAVYYPDQPLEDRNMVLEARFYGLRFLLGLRVGGVTDTTIDRDGKTTRVWGWNYRTLQGHLEMGQMDYEIWKWLETGEVEFRIHAISKAGLIPNPIIRLGFSVFGRWMQKRFALRALDRMERLVEEALRSGVAEAEQTVERTEVSPVEDLGE